MCSNYPQCIAHKTSRCANDADRFFAIKQLYTGPVLFPRTGAVTLSFVDHKTEIKHLADGCIYCTEHCTGMVSCTDLLLQCCKVCRGYCKHGKQLFKGSRPACFDALTKLMHAGKLYLRGTVSLPLKMNTLLKAATAQACTEHGRKDTKTCFFCFTL